jgi:hypothetical protein
MLFLDTFVLSKFQGINHLNYKNLKNNVQRKTSLYIW